MEGTIALATELKLAHVGSNRLGMIVLLQNPGLANLTTSLDLKTQIPEISQIVIKTNLLNVHRIQEGTKRVTSEVDVLLILSRSLLVASNRRERLGKTCALY